MSINPTPKDLGLSASLFPAFREGQAELAARLALSAFPFSFLNAPCGSGKSLTYYTSALLLDLRLLILTPQLAHQDQLMRDFGPPHGDLADVRGQSNYQCPKYSNCEIGAANECPLRRSADHNRCQNIKAIEHARASKHVVANYAFHMTQGRAKSRANEAAPSPGIGTFDMIVFDEGHGVPEKLAEFCAVSFLEREMEQLLDIEVPQGKSLGTWSEWARVSQQRTPEALKHAASPKERFRLLSIQRDLNELSGASADTRTQWIYQSSDGKHTFSPVWATTHAERLLFQGTKKIILASATLLPSIGKYLGIDPVSSEYIDVANGFDPKNRPFIYVPSGVRLRYDSSPGDIRVLMSKYDQVIDLWRGHRGLIHTQSYELQRKLLSVTRNRARMIVCEKGRMSGAEALEILKRSDPRAGKIVVGPGLKEGFSLDDDLARFQIVAKMPIINRTDPVTDARCVSIPEYSKDQTAIQLMQSAGRIVRNRNDWGYTYTSDGAWEWVRKQVPQSFKDTERWEKEHVPGPPQEREP